MVRRESARLARPPSLGARKVAERETPVSQQVRRVRLIKKVKRGSALPLYTCSPSFLREDFHVKGDNGGE